MQSFRVQNVMAFMLIIAVSMITRVESLECYSCWSNATGTVNCAVGPVANSANIDCPDTDSCLTAIVDGVTFRGCSSSISLPPNYPLKDTCNDEYCNYKIYPADRIVCHKCEGDTCNKPPTGGRACLIYSDTDQCYTDVISNTNTIRGCVSDGNHTATEYTVTCGSNLCNNQPAFEPLECINCASNDTLDCIRPASPAENCQISITTSCTVDVLLGRQGACYTYQSGDYIERGCAKDTSSMGKNTTYSVEYETKCYTDQCNNECIPQSVCYTCDSISDPNCGNDLSSFTPETCSSQEISSCFTCIGTDDVVFRGCGTGDNNNSLECEICINGTGCNQQLFEKTTTTTTEATTVTTTSTTEAVPETTTISTTEVPTNSTSETPTTNTTTEPPQTDSIECYQCNGTAECLLLMDEAKPLPCPDANDQCYQVMSQSKMYRGCLSEDVGQLCANDRSLCRICGESGCNDLPLVRDSNLTCMQCFSLDCEWGMGPDASSPCSKVYYFQNETCYIFRNPDGLVERGCASNLRCLTNGWNCDYCASDDCNAENLIWQSCLQCDSSDNIDCITGKDIISTRCPAEIQTFEDRGCYVLLQEDGHIVRGCLANLNTTGLDEDRYTTCLNQSCNTMNFNSGSSQLHGYFVTCLLSAILILVQTFS